MMQLDCPVSRFVCLEVIASLIMKPTPERHLSFSGLPYQDRV